MKEQIESSFWPFKLDETNLYAYYEQVFSVEECQKIIDIGKNKYLQKAKVFNKDKNVEKPDYRDTNICWLTPSDNLEWVYARLTDVVMTLNEKYFNFDLQGFMENSQFSNYIAPSGKYKKHMDMNYNCLIRKLSISVQLSNPDDYEGGDLNVYESDEGTSLMKSQGSVVAFPSYVLHEVTPVTKGERNALVMWVTGKPFK